MFSDISEIGFKVKKIFSYNKFNIISFFDKDHGPRDGTSLKEWVIKNLKDIGIDNDRIQVKLFCYPRIFGYVFNPLSIFFVYNQNSKLISVLYEVKNTFGEQHTYIFKTNDDKTIINSCNKKFHIPCIQKWLCEDKDTCPCCRTEISIHSYTYQVLHNKLFICCFTILLLFIIILLCYVLYYLLDMSN